MSARHFFNDPKHLVLSALRSITQTNPSLEFDESNKIISRRAHAKPQVALVSGGGSGHEPSFAAFVGDGLLSASVAGTVFASPSAEQIRRCILQRVDARQGVLVIVMNYTGDVLNFGMAVEKAKASGLDVDMVVVADDAGVTRSQGGKVGRRGIAGTVLVQKIAGALAATGASLSDVSKVTRLAAENVVSIGSSLSHVHVPGRKADDVEEMALGEVEIGMGIHNEAGSERAKVDLSTLVSKMLKYSLDTSDRDRGFADIKTGDQVVLLVNNLGGVSPLELGGITSEVLGQLETTYKIKPARVLSGTYMTSLNGLGFSISILKLVKTGMQSSMVELLDAPAEATGWPMTIRPTTWQSGKDQAEGQDRVAENTQGGASDVRLDLQQTRDVLGNALAKVIAAEPEITKYDTVVGDGDCGIGLKRGAEAVKKVLDVTTNEDAALLVDEITAAIETNMDGTSGALYAIYMNALAAGIRKASSKKEADTQTWAEAARSALQSMSKYTPAKVGDRTLVDALEPFVSTLQRTSDVKKAAQAAEEGAEKTRGMKASLGRTVYVGGEGYQEVPDPGAHGLALFFSGLAEKL